MKPFFTALISLLSKYAFLLLFLATFKEGACTSAEELMSTLFAQGVTVDLRDPIYTDGALCTEKGGVIQGPNIRVQAQKITYIRKLEEGVPIYTIEAEGQLIVEFNDYIFVGDRLEYDFQSKSGIVYNGKTAMNPWFFGGEEIYLEPDGSYRLYHGFITTSENVINSWEIHVDEASINKDQFVTAKNLQFRYADIPFLWLPYLRLDLDAICDTPFKYRVRWGGFQGPRIGVIYEMISWERFKAFLRVDVSLKRGPGGGLETEYYSEDRKEFFLTCNYIARDSPTDNPKQHTRYRFEGLYGNRLFDDRVTVGLSYDKLSDREMETDYFEMGLELKTAHRTELLIRQQMDNLMITNFLTRVRINGFETMKQELPSFEGSFHPITLGSTGIVTDNRFSLSYLDFIYDRNQLNLKRVKNYSSTRFEFNNTFYRPFSVGPFINTPEAGFVSIYYGNRKNVDFLTNNTVLESNRGRHWLALGTFGYGITTQISRNYETWKHAIEPYTTYNYYTSPTISPNEHNNFDISDGWYRLDKLRFGCRNLVYVKREDCLIFRYLLIDVFADAFFHTPTIYKPIPTIYAQVIWETLPSMRNTITYAWDTERHQTGYINLRNDWTLSQDFAIATEYRHRNAFSWRKADHNNFIMESFRSESELRASQLSDKRDTLLLTFFYRFMPNWALSFDSRFGWNRRFEASYDEYEIDLLTTLAKAWNLKISYQHKEDDHRVALYINLGVHPPKEPRCGCGNYVH